MSSKNRNVKGIDLPAPIAGQGGTPTIEIANVLPPAQPNIGAPYELAVIGSDLLRSAATPTARVTLRWRPPVGVAVTRYEVQAARNSGFTVGLVGQPALEESAQVAYLDTGTTYYFRVRAIAGALQSPWSNVVSVTTEQDTTPPNPPSALAAAFLSDGALRITWQLPTSPNFRAVELRIWNGAGKAVEYDVIPEAGGTEYRWPAARNRQQTVGSPDSSPDPAVFIEARSVSWSNIYSTIVSASATKAVPANISGLAVDFAGPDAIFTCNAIADAVAYEWTIDGRLYETTYPTFTYTYAENQLRHSGTAVPSLPYSIRARDALDQRSAAAVAGTAANAAPLATTIAAQGVFATIALTITPSTALDLRNYRVRVYKDTVLQSGETFFTTELSPIYTVKTGSGSYTFDVTVYDIFDQASPVSVLSVAQQATDITQFIASLREGANYSRLIGGAVPAGTKTAWSDGNTTSGGANVTADPNWQWIEVARDYNDRYRTITIGRFAMASGSLSWYLALSADGVTWRYFTAPFTVLAGRILMTEHPNESDARTAGANIVTNATANTRWELPSIVEARFVRLWMLKSDVTWTLREFYPRRLVQSDDLEAESVTTVNLGAASVTADKTFIGQLSAITGDMGNLTAGTVTGALIRTAASGERVQLDSANGIQNFDSSGNVLLQLQPGNGLSVAMTATSALNVTRAVTFVSGSNARGSIRGYLTGGVSYAALSAIDSLGAEKALVVAQSDGQVEIRTGGYPIVRIEEYPGNILLDALVRGFNFDTASVAGTYRVGGTQVLRSRRTGWGSPTGTATRTAFATGSVTLVQLAERVKALIDDLRDHHGALGA